MLLLHLCGLLQNAQLHLHPLGPPPRQVLIVQVLIVSANHLLEIIATEPVWIILLLLAGQVQKRPQKIEHLQQGLVQRKLQEKHPQADLVQRRLQETESRPAEFLRKRQQISSMGQLPYELVLRKQASILPLIDTRQLGQVLKKQQSCQAQTGARLRDQVQRKQQSLKSLL